MVRTIAEPLSPTYANLFVEYPLIILAELVCIMRFHFESGLGLQLGGPGNTANSTTIGFLHIEADIKKEESIMQFSVSQGD